MQVANIPYKLVPASLRLLIKPIWLYFRKIFFWIPFLFSWLVGGCRKVVRRSLKLPYDLIFVLDKQDEKWTLGAICREIAKHSVGRVGFYYGRFYRDFGKLVPFWPRPVKLPDAKAYLFADSRFLLRCLKATPSVWFRRLYVWYAHPEDLGPKNEIVFALIGKEFSILCSLLRLKRLFRNGCLGLMGFG
jgi:hypothetical protein